MDTNVSGMSEEFERATAELRALRQFYGPAKDFWPRFLTATAQLAAADVAVLLLGKPDKTPRWSKIGEWSAGSGQPRLRSAFVSSLERTAEQVIREGSFVDENDESTGAFTIGVRLKTLRAEDEVVLALQVIDFTEAAAREALARLELAADTPALYLGQLASRQAQADVEKFATVLDLLVPVNSEKHALAAQLALCNAVATRFRCDRVSLGWLEGGYAKLTAISRTEKFDRQMEAAQALEAAMEECIDQDEELVFPAPEGSTAVLRFHEKFVTEQSAGNLASVPLRIDGSAVAALSCERQATAFTTVELQQIRLLADHAARRLFELKKNDRWFGARFAGWLREKAAKALGPEHTWKKVIVIGVVLLLLALFIVRVTYRAEGNFILRSDKVSFLTAPFDGYIDEVHVRTGDRVPKDGKLVTLNRSELLLEESAALAELSRYQREAEKARAAKQLAEMRIDESLAQQAKSRLDLVRYRLENSILKSPVDGVVVEGDLRERIDAPVKQGDALFKVAQLDALYVEAEVNERDVKEILKSSKAEIAFVTQPKLKYPATVETIQPAAVPKKEQNVFLVRLKLDRAPDGWWRPGMTGVCKIEVEKRTLWWILTHRTVDFLRLKLWW